MTIPVIDFSGLDGVKRAETLAQIANGCEEWGFFQLVNHGIPEELLERVRKVSSESYKLMREAAFKESTPVQLLNQLIDQEARGGAVQKLEDVDWEDAFLLHDDNEWPSDPADLKETLKEYRGELMKLAHRVMEAMEENLGLEKGSLQKAFTAGGEHAAFFGTKVSHYPPCPRPDLVYGLRPHTDAGGVGLLFQDDEAGGLQILKDGEWIDLQPVKNAIVINTGDQIEVLSNGRYKSVWHRVLAFTEGNRRFVASFLNPSYKATIAPATTEAAAGEPETSAYPRFLFGDYMDVYVKQKYLPKEPRFHAVAAAAI